MRKILSCILAAAMLLSLLVVVAGAAEADTPGKVILRPSAKVNGDGTVTYTFTLDATGSDGVGALEFFITPRGMTYKSVAYRDGGNLDKVFKSEDDYEGVTGYGFYETDGHFIAFGGNANAVSPRMLTGSVPLIAVTYTITDDSNYGLEKVTFKACYSGEKAMTESGRYTCEIADVTTEPTGVLRGDINGDGKVTMADLVYFSRYFAGWAGYTVDSKAADVNNDSKVTMADIVYLARYFAGWKGYTLD